MSKFYCVRQVLIDWNDIMLITNNHKEIQLPNKAAISIWTPTSLNDIEQYTQYDIRIMARVLDHVTEINILPIPTQPSAPIELLGKSITGPRHEIFEGLRNYLNSSLPSSQYSYKQGMTYIHEIEIYLTQF